MTLNDVFCEQIRLKPCEARSHFEVVDPGVWRIDRAGMLVGLGDDWAGPFCLRLDGVDYEAYGLKARLATSQRQFLEDVGISFDGGMEVAKLLRMGVIAVVVLAVVGVLVFMLFRPHQPSSAAAKQSDESGVDELFARAEARRVKNHLPGNSSKVVTLDELKTMATKRNVGTASLKERARAAFQAGKWAEAIPLVDQLTEETVDADLMYYIGIAYKEGYAVEHDFPEALYWFRKSADGGHAGSQYEMGLANERGNGVQKNEAEAARWYRIAADRGNAPANLSLGILYEEGRGVVRSDSEAANLYRRGNDLGNAHAGYLLGKLYEEGRGVPLSLSKAAEYYRKAGTAGHALSGYLLGKMYEEGRGIQKDAGEALYWYEKAGKLGNSAAMSAWQRLRGTDKRWLHPEK